MLLFCPEIGILEAKMRSNNDRVRKFFGRESFENRALTKAKQALVARLHVDKDHLLTPENLANFILTRANEIILSPLRPVKVLKNPQKELAELFRELVGKEQRQRRPKLLVPELEAVFQRLHKEGRAVVDYAINVPVIGRTVRVPYAYHNGAMHLVKPERFSDVESVATATAMKLAVEGDLLKRYGRDQEGEKRLVVVSSFAGDQPHPAGAWDLLFKGRSDARTQYRVRRRSLPRERTPVPKFPRGGGWHPLSPVVSGWPRLSHVVIP